MSTAPLTLPTRPRRARVQREPTQSQAAKALRKVATPTTGVTWRRSGLPGWERASAGVPLAETLCSVLIVVLLFVPVAVVTGLALWVPIAAAAAVAVASYLLWARRVVVGDQFVAVRQLGRYHVATVDHVKHLELKPSSHGGVLCLHTDDGRCMRLRRAEVTHPQVGPALRALAARHEGTRDPLVESLLQLPHEEHRIRHRYLADALQ